MHSGAEVFITAGSWSKVMWPPAVLPLANAGPCRRRQYDVYICIYINIYIYVYVIYTYIYIYIYVYIYIYIYTCVCIYYEYIHMHMHKLRSRQQKPLKHADMQTRWIMPQSYVTQDSSTRTRMNELCHRVTHQAVIVEFL